MQLTKFSDFGLRLLMYLLQPHDELITIAQAAQDLNISTNHLIKVSHFLTKQGWIDSTRGKGGGIRLSDTAYTLPIGDILRTLEHDKKAVDCTGLDCILRTRCGLKSFLDEALDDFYQSLNRYQLKDALEQPLFFKQKSSSIPNDKLAIPIHFIP